MGILPATFPSRDNVDWLPVDKLSTILVEILWSSPSVARNPLIEDRTKRRGSRALNGTRMSTPTYHVVNPQASSWSRDIVPILLNSFPKNTIRPVSFEEWIGELKSNAEAGADIVDRIPAIRLIDFYEACLAGKDAGRSVMSSAAAGSASTTLRDLGAVRSSWVERWLTQWTVGVAP
jgi:hypothetical protein